MYDIGFDDYLFGGGITVVEWADNIRELFDMPYYEIRILKDLSVSENYRKKLKLSGGTYEYSRDRYLVTQCDLCGFVQRRTDGRIFSICNKKTHSQMLMPMLDDVLKKSVDEH
ncbi:MAG: hypothetical protein L6V93_11155 [Clostridiales bacterium]|nr:MAG: hypothetical protein L6V93_11155 [Clostridiales bacterium]